MILIRWRQRCQSVGMLSAFALSFGVIVPQASQAQGFQVFCTNNGDGTVSCSGWQGGETLTCVVNAGGTSSCSTPSGRSFACVRESGGVTSCSPGGGGNADRPVGTDTDCTFTGDGNFSCTPPRPATRPLLPGPRLPGVDFPGTTIPDLPSTVPVDLAPSVFD